MAREDESATDAKFKKFYTLNVVSFGMTSITTILSSSNETFHLILIKLRPPSAGSFDLAILLAFKKVTK